MLLFLSLTGIIVSLILVIFNARRYRSSLYLGGFFFLVSLYGLMQYVLVSSHSLLLITLFFVHPGFLAYLIGPMIYWYVRGVLTDNARMRPSDMLHGIPALIFLISVIPYFLLPWAEKTQNAALLSENITNLQCINASLLYDFIPAGILFISRPLLVLAYTIWCMTMLISWYAKRGKDGILSQQRYMIQWLVVLLGFLFILSVCHLIAITIAYRFGDIQVFFTLNLLQLFSGIGLTGLLISPLFFPSILYGMPRIPAINPGDSPLGPDSDPVPDSVSKPVPDPGPTPVPSPQASPHQTPVLQVSEASQKPAFEDEYLNQIANKLDHCMETLQPYLQHDCNLAYMAKLTGIPAHHLAYYFREEKQQPFTDYRNEWRVRHAKELIREGKAKELTLEAIGLLSGFATRNTFYTAFKKMTGISASAYISKQAGTPQNLPEA